MPPENIYLFASEIIKHLKQLIEDHGDIPVVMCDGSCYYGVSGVNIVEERYSDEDGKEPEMLLDNPLCAVFEWMDVTHNTLTFSKWISQASHSSSMPLSQ